MVVLVRVFVKAPEEELELEGSGRGLIAVWKRDPFVLSETHLGEHGRTRLGWCQGT